MLKIKIFNWYVDIQRKPILQHRNDTLEQIKHVSKLDHGLTIVEDTLTLKEEDILK